MVQIGSCTDGRALAPWLRVMARVTRPLPDWMVRAVVHSTIGMGRLGPMDGSTRALLAQMVREIPIPFVRWGVRAILSWPGQEHVEGARIVRVHGERDRVLRLPRAAKEDEVLHVVRSAGHVVGMTHAREVAEVMKRWGGER